MNKDAIELLKEEKEEYYLVKTIETNEVVYMVSAKDADEAHEKFDEGKWEERCPLQCDSLHVLGIKKGTITEDLNQ